MREDARDAGFELLNCCVGRVHGCGLCHGRCRRVWLAAQVVRPVLPTSCPTDRRRKLRTTRISRLPPTDAGADLRRQREALRLTLAQLRQLDVAAGIAVADEAQARARRQVLAGANGQQRVARESVARPVTRFAGRDSR